MPSKLGRRLRRLKIPTKHKARGQSWGIHLPIRVPSPRQPLVPSAVTIILVLNRLRSARLKIRSSIFQSVVLSSVQLVDYLSLRVVGGFDNWLSAWTCQWAQLALCCKWWVRFVPFALIGSCAPYNATHVIRVDALGSVASHHRT